MDDIVFKFKILKQKDNPEDKLQLEYKPLDEKFLPKFNIILDNNMILMRNQIVKLDFVKKCSVERIKGRPLEDGYYEAHKLFIKIKVNEAHYVAELLTDFDFKSYIKSSCKVCKTFGWYKWEIKIEY